MNLWKKGILFFLSIAILLLYAFNRNEKSNPNLNKASITEKNEPSSLDLAEAFFDLVENKHKDSIAAINKIGQKISELDTMIAFYPFDNQYEMNTFIFSAPNESYFRFLTQSSFLREDVPIGNKQYKVWRKKINGVKILDLSIEPHPILQSVFIVRFREQE